MKSIVIAAPHSGAGKTTITIGLMECLRRRGLKVAPFKVGPDFIDPGYHGIVCGIPSVNLDGWMCPPAFVRDTFARHAGVADVAVIEGAMGLFDGISGVSDQGSTAHVARITGAPVILVVDAKSQGRSAAALVKGFAGFDPRVRVAGVIFNNVAGDNHARVLRDAVETADLPVRVIGCIPRDDRLHIPSRHLGLLTAEENPLPAEFLDHLAEVIRNHVDLGLLWTVGNLQAAGQESLFLEGDGALRAPSVAPAAPPVRLGVAKDAAFCFVYRDNLRLLEEAGGEIVPFSPLTDATLPAGISGMYLPGGYPEIHADALAANTGMKGAIRQAVAAGMPVYAECGGFIYLCRGIEPQSEGGGLRELVGVFPTTATMRPRRRALGYREVELAADSFLGERGITARGHEFHYSDMGEMPAEVERLYRVRKNGAVLGDEGFRINNCLASYIHLHFGSAPHLAGSFVNSCRRYQNRNSHG